VPARGDSGVDGEGGGGAGTLLDTELPKGAGEGGVFTRPFVSGFPKPLLLAGHILGPRSEPLALAGGDCCVCLLGARGRVTLTSTAVCLDSADPLRSPGASLVLEAVPPNGLTAGPFSSVGAFAAPRAAAAIVAGTAAVESAAAAFAFSIRVAS
jgi:hypothetical protein